MRNKVIKLLESFKTLTEIQNELGLSNYKVVNLIAPDSITDIISRKVESVFLDGNMHDMIDLCTRFNSNTTLNKSGKNAYYKMLEEVIIALMRKGMSIKEVAKHLGVSPTTVRARLKGENRAAEKIQMVSEERKILVIALFAMAGKLR